jgi:hypothetical protein
MAKDCWAKGGSKEGQHLQNYKGSSRKGKWNGKKKNSANLDNNNSEDESQATFMAVLSDNPLFDPRLSRDTWLTDSGCLVHIANKQEIFTNYTHLSGETINGLGDKIVKAYSRGTITLETNQWSKEDSSLYNTLYAPTAVNNLLSIPCINDVGGSAEFQHGKANIKARNCQLILQGKKKSRLYWLDNVYAVKAENRVNAGNAKEVDRNSWASWHR